MMLATVAMNNPSPQPHRSFKFHDEMKRFSSLDDNETARSDEEKETRVQSPLNEGGVQSPLNEGEVQSPFNEGGVQSPLNEGNSNSSIKDGIPSMVSNYPAYNDDCPSMVVSMETNSRVSMATDILSKHDSDEDVANESTQIKSDPVVRRGKRKKYQKYTPEDRIAIGKYCFEHGPAAARKAFQSRYPEMSESVTRGFRDKYKLMIGETAVYEFELERRQKESEKRIEPLPRGRPRKVIQLDDNYALPTMVESKGDVRADIRSESPPSSLATQNGLSHEEKMRIGGFYIKYGMITTLKELQDVPYLNESLTMSCYRYYLNSCQQTEHMNEALINDTSNRSMVSVGGDWQRRSITESDSNHYTMSSPPRYREIAPKPDYDIIPNIKHSLHDSVHYRQRSASPPRFFQNPKVVRGYDYNSYDRAIPISKNSYENNASNILYSKNLATTDKSSREKASSRSRSTSPNREFTEKRAFSPPMKSNSLSPGYKKSTSPYEISMARSNRSPIIHYPKVVSPEINNNSEKEYQRDCYEYSLNREREAVYYNTPYPFDNQPSVSPPIQQADHVKQEESTVSSSSMEPRSKRFKYQKYTPEDRYNIGKLCNEIGLGATVKVYREKFPRLNESVVRTFRNRYRELLEKGDGVAKTEAIERKPSSRKSSSTLIIEGEVVSQLNQFRISHIELTENLVMAVAENVIAGKDPKDVAGVRSMITRSWANQLLWKHKLIDKPLGNTHGACCDRCKTLLVCPKC